MKLENGVEMPESEQDLAQAADDVRAWADGAPARALRDLDRQSGMKAWERKVVLAILPADDPQYAKAAAAEQTAVPLRDAVANVQIGK